MRTSVLAAFIGLVVSAPVAAQVPLSVPFDEAFESSETIAFARRQAEQARQQRDEARRQHDARQDDERLKEAERQQAAQRRRQGEMEAKERSLQRDRLDRRQQVLEVQQRQVLREQEKLAELQARERFVRDRVNDQWDEESKAAARRQATLNAKRRAVGQEQLREQRGKPLEGYGESRAHWFDPYGASSGGRASLHRKRQP